jgi:hypothetical protein
MKTTTINAFGYEHTFIDTNAADEGAIIGRRFTYLLCGSDENVEEFANSLADDFQDLYYSEFGEALIFSDEHLELTDLTFAEVLGIAVHEEEVA